MGLRIQILPTIHNISPSLKKKWEENLQACSAMMMALLVDDYKKQMISLDQEIEKLYATNSKNIEKGQLKDIEKEIKENLITFNQEIINKKETKFRKDLAAFNNHRAYRWPSPNQPSWKGRRGRGYPRESENSEASDNSSVRSFTSTHSGNQRAEQHHQFQQRGRRYGRGGWGHLPIDNMNKPTHVNPYQHNLVSNLKGLHRRKE